MTLAPGTIILGKYVVEGHLGAGASGEVYRVRRPGPGPAASRHTNRARRGAAVGSRLHGRRQRSAH